MKTYRLGYRYQGSVKKMGDFDTEKEAIKAAQAEAASDYAAEIGASTIPRVCPLEFRRSPYKAHRIISRYLGSSYFIDTIQEETKRK